MSRKKTILHSRNGARRRKEVAWQSIDPLAYMRTGHWPADPLGPFNRAYSAHVWVYACVRAIAVNVASVDILPYIKTVKDGRESWAVDQKHELYPLLRMPNPYMSGYLMREYVGASLALTGNAFWYAETMGGKKIVELWPLLPDNVKVVTTRERMIDHYVLVVGGTEIPLPYEKVIHFRSMNPNSFTWGQGSLAAAKTTVTTDIFAQIWNKSFFANAARPDGALETDKVLGDPVRKRILESWKDMHQGAGNNGNTALLEAGLKYKRLGESAKDMDFVNLRKDLRIEVCAAFGVPPSVVGLLEFANYSNMEQQYKTFWTSRLLPDIRNIAETLTLRAQQMTFRVGVEFQGDTSKVEALRVDQKQQADIFKIYVDAGVPPNQVVAMLDLPIEEYEGWDESKQPAQPFGAAPDSNPPEDPAEEDSQKALAQKRAVVCECGVIFDWSSDSQCCPGCMKVVTQAGKAVDQGPSPEERERMRTAEWQVFDSKARGHEGEMREAVRAFFKGQKRRFEEALRKEYASIIGKDLNWVQSLLKLQGHAKSPKDAVELAFNIERERELMKKSSGRLIRGTYFDFAVRVARKVDPNFDFSLQDPVALAWIEAKASKLALEANRFTLERLSAQISEAVQDAVAAGFSESETIAQIADRIDAVYAFAVEGRAERIARTEVISAANAGTQDAFERTGVERKEWLSSRDSLVRETHQKMDGQTVGVKESFLSPSGAALRFPGDPDAPADEIVNCRCTPIARYED